MPQPQPLPGDLHSKPARPATLSQFITCNIIPFLITFKLYLSGLLPAISHQLRHPSLFNFFNPFHWKALIFANGFPVVLKTSDILYANMKQPLLRKASGRVLEIGAGAGDNLAYYDVSKIERLFALEPYEPLRVQLATKLQKLGLAGKTTIIPAGLDEPSSLLKAGIEPNSLDTIVLFQVLCSIPQPKTHLPFLQSLLKPGGQILLFEHVASKHTLARSIQNLWTPFWRFNFGGCELNRDSGEWLEKLGGWKEVELQRPVIETDADLIPHAIGRLVKA